MVKLRRIPKTPEFRRANHPDFWDDKERKDNEWTGTRFNTITEDHEFWILGERVKTVSKIARALDPKAVQKAHVELFALMSKDIV